MITEFAPAKLNLHLHVTGRRDDGYHLLDSLVAFADVGDGLSFAPADELSLGLTGPFAGALSAEPDNLVLRAARGLAALAGIAPKAAITLGKRLPVASGIGGGSSDAAATLRGLCRLWRLAPEPEALAALALSLGADVPVCLDPRPWTMRGVGDDLIPAEPLPPAWLVLVNPGVAVATAAVFAQRKYLPFSEPASPAAPASFDDLIEMLDTRRNELTDAAIWLAPAIAEVLAMLDGHPACRLARMSGSGATCFALCETEEDAARVARFVARQRPAWWVAACGWARAAG